MAKKVLVTGMSGLIGGLLKDHLLKKGGYELTALNRRPVQGVRTVQADISDLEAIKPAFKGQDTVVHLSAVLTDATWEETLRVNVLGTYNVFEAARLAGVKRVVFASSGSAIKGWEDVSPYKDLVEGKYDKVPKTWPMIGHEHVRPRAFYGASKVCGEAIGRVFADTYGLSILCVRIGTVRPSNKPENVEQRSIYLSHGDLTQMLEKCIEAPPSLKYDIFMATSRNKWGYRDLEHARQVLGYVPKDTAESSY
jgi:nucleoside-diphosphate-sugar epimerase